jgi:hypothetical protein
MDTGEDAFPSMGKPELPGGPLRSRDVPTSSQQHITKDDRPGKRSGYRRDSKSPERISDRNRRARDCERRRDSRRDSSAPKTSEQKMYRSPSPKQKR